MTNNRELTEQQEREIYDAENLLQHVYWACAPEVIEKKYGITRKQRVEVVRKWRIQQSCEN